jgi:hypothetical protein
VSEHEKKVRQLIALALNAGATDGESRNAAISALRLIEKHGLLDEDGRPSPAAAPTGDAYSHIVIANYRQRVAELEQLVRGARMHDTLLNARIAGLSNELDRAHEEIVQLKREIMEERRKRQDADDRARRFRDHRPATTVTTEPSNGPRRKIIRSKYTGTCARCKESFEVGERIAWRSGNGALHLACYERELQEIA